MCWLGAGQGPAGRKPAATPTTSELCAKESCWGLALTPSPACNGERAVPRNSATSTEVVGSAHPNKNIHAPVTGLVKDSRQGKVGELPPRVTVCGGSVTRALPEA